MKPPFRPLLVRHSSRTNASEPITMHATDSGAICACIRQFNCFPTWACNPQTGCDVSIVSQNNKHFTLTLYAGGNHRLMEQMSSSLMQAKNPCTFGWAFLNLFFTRENSFIAVFQQWKWEGLTWLSQLLNHRFVWCFQLILVLSLILSVNQHTSVKRYPRSYEGPLTINCKTAQLE